MTNVGMKYWTSDAFEAMSIAAKMGRKVGLYPSGQYSPGMFSRWPNPSQTFYGYGVLDPAGGFTWLDFTN